MSHTYLTTDELARRIKYHPRTIRNRLKDSVLLEGRHYFKPFGGRKVLYVWEHIEEDMQEGLGKGGAVAIPMASGPVINIQRGLPVPPMRALATSSKQVMEGGV